jgi:hypothetical protein
VIPHRRRPFGVSLAKRLARIYASGFCRKRKNTGLTARNIQLQSKADIATLDSVQLPLHFRKPPGPGKLSGMLSAPHRPSGIRRQSARKHNGEYMQADRPPITEFDDRNYTFISETLHDPDCRRMQCWLTTNHASHRYPHCPYLGLW